MKISKALPLLLSTVFLVMSSFLYSADAQPSASQLANQMEETHTRYLSNIETISITLDREFLGPETLTYRTEMEDGRPVLRSAEDDDEDPLSITANNSGQMRIFISGSSSISSETYEGRSVYRVVVDDPEVFDRLEMEDDFADMDDEEFGEMKKATAWIGQDDMLLYRMEFEVEESGNIMTVVMTMDEYQTFEGLPIPMLSTMEIKGLENMMSDEEYREAREGMEELMRELEQMPEAQREMIKRQMAPQIEQFEQMMQGGSSGTMTTRVTEVRVN